MEILKVFALVLIALFASSLLKELDSNLWPFPPLVLAIVLLYTSVTYFTSLYGELVNLIPSSITGDAFSYLLKVTGICLCADIASTISEEAGYQTLSDAVKLFGRISMMFCILPLIKELIDVLI